MWMGGLVPLGYEARDRSLAINPTEADTVRTLYRLYLELRTVRRLKEAADRLGLVTRLTLPCRWNEQRNSLKFRP